MKKTYTAIIVFSLASMLFYGDLRGRATGICTRDTRGLTNSPSTCSTSGCHVGVVTIGTDTTSMADTVSTASPNGIADISFVHGIAAYPTLAADFVSITTSSASSGLAYTIYALDGHQMMAGDLPSYPAMTSVDVHALAPAHYIVRVSDASRSATFRIIKE